MEKKTNFTSEELLNKKLPHVQRGYDPYVVDSLLDKIIEDYELIEKVNSIDLEKLNKELEELRKANSSLKEELDKEKNKWKYITRDHKDIHIDNFELLQRIGKLEMVIYEKLNMNPDEIK